MRLPQTIAKPARSSPSRSFRISGPTATAASSSMQPADSTASCREARAVRSYHVVGVQMAHPSAFAQSAARTAGREHRRPLQDRSSRRTSGHVRAFLCAADFWMSARRRTISTHVMSHRQSQRVIRSADWARFDRRPDGASRSTAWSGMTCEIGEGAHPRSLYRRRRGANSLWSQVPELRHYSEGREAVGGVDRPEHLSTSDAIHGQEITRPCRRRGPESTSACNAPGWRSRRCASFRSPATRRRVSTSAFSAPTTRRSCSRSMTRRSLRRTAVRQRVPAVHEHPAADSGDRRPCRRPRHSHSGRSRRRHAPGASRRHAARRARRALQAGGRAGVPHAAQRRRARVGRVHPLPNRVRSRQADVGAELLRQALPRSVSGRHAHAGGARGAERGVAASSPTSSPASRACCVIGTITAGI